MSDVWLPAPENWVLADTAVHVHRLELSQNLTQFDKLLSSEERSRAARFHFARDQRRYTVARGALRVLIGRYEQMPPEHVRFGQNDFGKPLLAHDTDLQFNISHSQDLALLAFTRGRLIGVDVEFRRPLTDAEDIAQHNFSTSEYNIFHQLPEAQKNEAFFNCWTRKEAFIKAIGEGLSHPLDTFDVTFVPGYTARFLRIEGANVADWNLQTLHPHPNFAAAIAVTKWQGKAACYDWTGF